MIRFQANVTYSCRSVCDHGSVWTFTVAKRTAKTVTMTNGKTFRFNRQLTAYNNCETIFPQGRYSMAPILTADKMASN